jgi:serine protease Do
MERAMNILQQLSTEMGDVVSAARRSLVQISNGPEGQGAGTIWHSDGLIITNAHVVRKRSLKVKLPDGRVLPATILAHTPELDIAALSVEANNLPTIEVGDSHNLQPGEWVFAVGHPFGVTGAATAGIVIGTGTHLPEQPNPKREWIAVNLRLRPGNSGGPLVNRYGQLIGVNTIMTGPKAGGAVPVHVAKAYLREALGTFK